MMKNVQAAAIELALLTGDDFNAKRLEILRREDKRLRGMGHDAEEAQFIAERLVSAAIAQALALDNDAGEVASAELAALGFHVH